MELRVKWLLEEDKKNNKPRKDSKNKIMENLHKIGNRHNKQQYKLRFPPKQQQFKIRHRHIQPIKI